MKKNVGEKKYSQAGCGYVCLWGGGGLNLGFSNASYHNGAKFETTQSVT